MNKLLSLQVELKKQADSKKALILSRFFKTGQGEYAEGDIFLGLTVPQLRLISEKFFELSLNEISMLLKSKIHEERLISLLLLIHKFQKCDDRTKNEIVKIYLKHTRFINNWDLVDLSAPRILGPYLQDKPKDVLYKLARSGNLWERRISIISTLYFISIQKDAKTILELAEILLKDKHDLIHKAAGWMLREVGKRVSQKTLEEFLQKHHKNMPRTMLRYAVERLPTKLRKKFMEKNF